MARDYKRILEDFTTMAEQIAREGEPLLETYCEDGDWMLLVTYRYALDETDLSPEDVKHIQRLDCEIANVFPGSLLKKYAFLGENVTEWWSR